jgi:predicted phosphodiesterase
MKIRLLSDLHTEFRMPYKTHPVSEYRGEDVLVLAGDIASGSTNVVEVLKHFKSCGFPRIIYVPGNHEYYGTSYTDFNKKIRDKCRDLRGIHVLNPGSVIIDDVLFVGATLWTNFDDDFLAQSAARRAINDFRVIQDFDTDVCTKAFYDQWDYICGEYAARGDLKVVVVTHFLPAQHCIAPRWRGANVLNHYFANHLDNAIVDMQNTTWLFGHTHDHVETQIGETKLYANPHGYWNSGETETGGFNPYFTVTV